MEIEVKFRLDRDIKHIIQQFATFEIEKVEEDIYFNSPSRDFRETDEALRVRKDVEGFSITYKGPKVDSETKSREEIKLRVNDFNAAVELFKKLGFREAGRVVKKRTIYRVGNAIICLDDVEGLGKFVEIEVECDDLEKGKQEIFEIAEKLGFDKGESIRRSYLEMVLERKG
jgi:adenylate cyclase class 2